MEENKEVILTQEGFDNLEKELEYLKTEKRAEISEIIIIALGFSDFTDFLKSSRKISGNSSATSSL